MEPKCVCIIPGYNIRRTKTFKKQKDREAILQREINIWRILLPCVRRRRLNAFKRHDSFYEGQNLLKAAVRMI